MQAKGPAIDSFLNRHNELTQHNPALVDPVMRAIRDDWEELLGQIENLLEDREQSLQAAREQQDRQAEVDKDLANFVDELEKIEASSAPVQDKAATLKVGHSVILHSFVLIITGYKVASLRCVTIISLFIRFLCKVLLKGNNL